jgi:hypothetical protein
MSKLRQPLVRLGWLVTALALAGCGERELSKKDTYPVRGRVLVNGEPGCFIRVQLEPAKPGAGMPALGTTDANGMFELRTWSNDEQPDGAVPGQYKVILDDVRMPDDDRLPPIVVPKGSKPTMLPDEVRGKEVTTVEIKSGDNDLEDIKVP